MCGRYSLATPDPSDLRARFPIGDAVEVTRRYNVAPGDHVLAVTTSREGEPRGELLRWGLVPSWAESPNIGLKMINARVETAAERPAYRRAFERFRCLIVADGFYEWRRVSGGPKEPFHITRERRAAVRIRRAVVDLAWQRRQHAAHMHDPHAAGQLGHRAAPRPHADHPRSPARGRMVSRRHATDQLPSVLAGMPPSRTALRAVSSAVNDARYDGPECLAPPVPNGQATLF